MVNGQQQSGQQQRRVGLHNGGCMDLEEIIMQLHSQMHHHRQITEPTMNINPAESEATADNGSPPLVSMK
jgi:hypothetical protein